MARPALPKAVGYLHVGKDEPDERIAALEQQLYDYAERRGYDLSFIEWEISGRIAINRLTALFQRHQAEHLILLSIENITTHPVVELVFRVAVTLDANVEVHEINSRPNRSGSTLNTRT